MIYNEDCVSGAIKHLKSESVDLGIHDPPFGIHEASFDKHYKRKKEFLIDGYVEAPDDYYKFSLNWIEQAKRVLKPNGSMYIISGWSHLRHILNAVHDLDLNTINHIIWKFNFGVATKKKFVTSHYHILYVAKRNSKPKFRTFCRFGTHEKDDRNRSLNYQDLEDVFVINKEYTPSKKKNKNKLPDALIEKLILYSSDVNDVVCDFFLGNFTTALVSKRLGRIPVGFEINPESFSYWNEKLDNIEQGCKLRNLKVVENVLPKNQGKKITDQEINEIVADYHKQIKILKTKKEVVKFLCDKYGRGRFGIENILDKSIAV
jgi:site-specific DNA-methyltransferase (adenine-specific)